MVACMHIGVSFGALRGFSIETLRGGGSIEGSIETMDRHVDVMFCAPLPAVRAHAALGVGAGSVHFAERAWPIGGDARAPHAILSVWVHVGVHAD
jgi:hypothetical protein